jgi:hypothetical protein
MPASQAEPLDSPLEKGRTPKSKFRREGAEPLLIKLRRRADGTALPLATH